MKYHLEEEYEYDFELFGISTHEKDYRLCWAINNSLNISLERSSEDVELIFPHQEKKMEDFLYLNSNKMKVLMSIILLETNGKIVN